jgi:cytochrome bd-type quinol oxidase subunit 1
LILKLVGWNIHTIAIAFICIAHTVIGCFSWRRYTLRSAGTRVSPSVTVTTALLVALLFQLISSDRNAQKGEL